MVYKPRTFLMGLSNTFSTPLPNSKLKQEQDFPEIKKYYAERSKEMTKERFQFVCVLQDIILLCCVKLLNIQLTVSTRST